MIVENAKKHPDCEYCNAAEKIMDNHKVILSKAVSKISKLQRKLDEMP